DAHTPPNTTSKIAIETTTTRPRRAKIAPKTKPMSIISRKKVPFASSSATAAPTSSHHMVDSLMFPPVVRDALHFGAIRPYGKRVAGIGRQYFLTLRSL